MREKFGNYKGSELYYSGYKCGIKLACEDIEKGNEKQAPFKEDTEFIIGLNDGYNAYYKQHEDVKVLKKSH